MERERRRRQRFSMTQTIELSTSEGQFIQARGVNVSEGGLLCQADTEIPHGTYVMFLLPVSDEKDAKTVNCEGTVSRCVKDGDRFNIVISFSD